MFGSRGATQERLEPEAIGRGEPTKGAASPGHRAHFSRARWVSTELSLLVHKPNGPAGSTGRSSNRRARAEQKRRSSRLQGNSRGFVRVRINHKSPIAVTSVLPTGGSDPLSGGAGHTTSGRGRFDEYENVESRGHGSLDGRERITAAIDDHAVPFTKAKGPSG